MKGIGEEKKQLIRDLRQQKYTCKQVAEMKQNNSFLLDVSELTGDEAAIITELIKNPCVLEFFIKVQDVPIKKLVAICNYLESKEELEKMY